MRVYFLVAGFGTLALFGLPLLLAPLAWGRAFQWSVPEEPSLTRYLGRSLGAIATAVGVVAVILGIQDEPSRHLLLVAVLASGLLTVVHVVGGIERSQPWTETVEIALWLGLTAWGAVLYVV